MALDADPSVAGEDLGEIQWSTPDTGDAATVATLLGDAEVAAEEVVTEDEDTAAEIHLERVISALEAARSAL